MKQTQSQAILISWKKFSISINGCQAPILLASEWRGFIVQSGASPDATPASRPTLQNSRVAATKAFSEKKGLCLDSFEGDVSWGKSCYRACTVDTVTWEAGEAYVR